MVKSFSNLMTE